MKKKQLGKNNLLMRVNKKLGSTKVIAIICSIVAILILSVGNYAINIIDSVMLKDYKNLFGAKQLVRCSVISNPSVRLLYIILVVATFVYVCILAYRIYSSYTDMNIGQKGTDRFTTIDEIKEQYKLVPIKDKEFEGYGGIPVARVGNFLAIDDSNTNSCIVGITRSGKGEIEVVPAIDLYSRGSKKASMVILDMKMELICRSYDTLIARGYEVNFLNIQDPETGVQFNPLDLIVKYYMAGEVSDAELLCNSFAYSIYSGNSKGGGDDNAEFFLSNASSALSAMILAHIDDCNMQDIRDNAKAEIFFIEKQAEYEKLSEEERAEADERWQKQKPSIYTLENLKEFKAIPINATYKKTHENMKKVTVSSVYHTFLELARQYINPHTTQLDIYFQKRPQGDRAKDLYGSIEVSGDRTKGSIFSQALTKLNVYMYEKTRALTSASTFDIESLGFGDKPVALFIGVPFYDRSKDSIVSTLIGQIFQANARRAAATKELKCDRRIIFHLDEIGNYPAIKDFKSMITVGLGCEMIFNLFLQAYNQLDSTYGDDAETIKGNCGNHIFIQTSLLKTAEEFSKMLGNETITNITRSGKKLELSKSYTELYEQRELLTANELMLLREGEIVVKRVMKRKDKNMNKVKPYPIFASIEEGTDMKYSYEYLLDTFPQGKGLTDLNLPNIEKENIPEFFNYKYTMNKYAYEYIDSLLRNGTEEEIESLSDNEIAEYEIFKEFYKFDKQLKSIPNGSGIINFAKKNGISDINENMLLGDFVDTLVNSKLDIKVKSEILSLV